MNQIESYRSWGRIVGQFAFATFLNLFVMAFVVMSYDAPSSEKLWDFRVMATLVIATFFFVPTLVIFTIAAKLRREEKAAQWLAALTWIWPLLLVAIRFAVLALSEASTT